MYNDEGQRVVDRLDIVSYNAIFGFIVVILILFMFLPYKVAIFSSFSLPLCVLGTVFLMVYQGANFNIITMMALIICLGNLVDNSVVISEHYTRLREQGVNAQDAAVQAALQFWIPFTASTVTIIAAFLPMLVTTGVMGQFIKWIPITVTAALLFSLFEALILLPARLQFVDVQKASLSHKKSFLDKSEDFFEKIIFLAVKNKWKTFLLLVALVISGFVSTVLFNRFELFPADGIEYYVARYETKIQSSIRKTDLAGQEISELIQKKLDATKFESFVTRTGIQQVDVSDPQLKVGENVGFILISVKPGQAQFLDVNQVLKDLRSIEKPAALEKLSFENLAGGPPVGKPVTIRIRSLNEKQIIEFSELIINELKLKKGVFNVESDVQTPSEEIAIRVNEKMAAQAGLTTEDVGFNMRSALQGFTA
ncbi:MAG: efflux RND transporter permease subunit, partial [Pseudobdellovibrio sp.]